MPALAELKQHMLNDAELTTVWSCFMDRFATDPEFIARGEPVRNEQLEMVLARISGQLYPQESLAIRCAFTHIPEEHFYHGSIAVSGRPGAIFFFEDIETGMLAVCDQIGTGEMKYGRFKCRPKPRAAEPSAN